MKFILGPCVLLLTKISLQESLKLPSIAKIHTRCKRWSLSMQQDRILRERIYDNSTDEASALLVSDVTSYGISTALAEEHIMMGNYEEAERLARSAWELGSSTHQPNNIYSAYAQGILADALYGEEAYQEAAEAYRGALQTYERHYRSNTGPEAVEMVGAVQLIAWTMLSGKEYDEAIGACQTALGMTERLLGPNSTDVAASMVNLATAYINTGHGGIASELLLMKALKIYQSHQDPNDYDADGPNIATKMAGVYLTMGNMYYQEGLDMRAEEYYREVLSYGDAVEPDTLSAALKNLGTIHWRWGDQQTAEDFLLQSLESLKKIPGTETTCSVDKQNALHSMIRNLKALHPPPPMPYIEKKCRDPIGTRKNTSIA